MKSGMPIMDIHALPCSSVHFYALSCTFVRFADRFFCHLTIDYGQMIAIYAWAGPSSRASVIALHNTNK